MDRKAIDFSPMLKMVVQILGTTAGVVVAGSFYISGLEHSIDINERDIITMAGSVSDVEIEFHVLRTKVEMDRNIINSISTDQKVLQNEVEQEQKRALDFRKRTDRTLERILRKLDGAD